MSTELFKLTLAFRGLSDEDEEEAGVDTPETLDDDDEDEVEVDGAAVTPAKDDEEEEPSLEG